MSANTSALTTKQVRGAALLKIHHSILEIMRLSAPAITDPRPIADATNRASTSRDAAELFGTVVNLARSLILAVEQDALKSNGSGGDMGIKGKTFSTDLGVVGPLYYVGTKCTVKATRDEALKLLCRWKGREGMWDGEVGGDLFRSFWHMEQKIATRGYTDTATAIAGGYGGSAIDSFAGALRTDRVRLSLAESKKWEWKYKRDGNRNDGIYDDEAGLESSAFNLDLDRHSVGGEWEWSPPLPRLDIDIDVEMPQ